MTRAMYDATGSNADWVRANLPKPDLMAYYGTGSKGIVWTAVEVASFAGTTMVEIDQAFTGSPVATAVVRDVENGAWTVENAVKRAGWVPSRPTIYCNRSTLGEVIAHGWQGDIWLAWPGWNGQPLPAVPGCTIVAVQDAFHATYDHSVVLDPHWPSLPPVPHPGAMPSLTTLYRLAHAAWPIRANADHYVVRYQPPGTGAPVVLARPPQPLSGGAVHPGDLHIPGANGGQVLVDAIVDGKPVRIADFHMP